MERTEVLDMMSSLKLYGMRSAYDETLATALKRKHEPQRFVGDLLKAEISEKQARSIKYQLTVAKLPLAKATADRRHRRALLLSAAMKEVGIADRQELGRRLNNRAENSHQPFRRRERAMQRFRSIKSLQKFSSVHAEVHNHFNQERHLVTRQVYKQRRSAT